MTDVKPQHLDVEINQDPEATLGADTVILDFARGLAGERLVNAGRAIVSTDVAYGLVLGLIVARERIDELAERDKTFVPFVLSVRGSHLIVRDLKRQQGGEPDLN